MVLGKRVAAIAIAIRWCFCLWRLATLVRILIDDFACCLMFTVLYFVLHLSYVYDVFLYSTKCGEFKSNFQGKCKVI